jgi:hypothetical protein
MSPTASSPLLADARFKLTAEEEGVLPLGLKQGDILSIERWSVSLHIEPYEAFLEIIWEALPPERLWREVERFLARPLAVLEERGVRIPRDLFSLQPGDEIVLQILSRGFAPEIYVYPCILGTVRRDLAIEIDP